MNWVGLAIAFQKKKCSVDKTDVAVRTTYPDRPSQYISFQKEIFHLFREGVGK